MSQKNNLFLDIFKNSEQGQLLSRIIGSEKKPHAFLIWGTEPNALKEITGWLSKIVLCEFRQGDEIMQCRNCRSYSTNTHPDLMQFGYEQNISIDEVRKIGEFLSTRPFLGVQKICVLQKVDHASYSAMRALLKTLEEPKGESILVLTASDRKRLPSTILSRCLSIRIKPDSLINIKKTTGVLKINEDKLIKIYKQCGGDMWEISKKLSNNIEDQLPDVAVLNKNFVAKKIDFLQNYFKHDEIDNCLISIIKSVRTNFRNGDMHSKNIQNFITLVNTLVKARLDHQSNFSLSSIIHSISCINL